MYIYKLTHTCTYTLTCWTHTTKRRSRAKRSRWTKGRSRVKWSRWFGWIPGRHWPKRYAHWTVLPVRSFIVHEWLLSCVFLMSRYHSWLLCFTKYTVLCGWLFYQPTCTNHLYTYSFRILKITGPQYGYTFCGGFYAKCIGESGGMFPQKIGLLVVFLLVAIYGHRHHSVVPSLPCVDSLPTT